MLLAHPVLAPNPLPAISVTYDLAFPACSAGTVQLGLSDAHFRHLAEVNPTIAWAAGPDGTVDYISPLATDIEGEAMQKRIDRWYSKMHTDDFARVRAEWLAWLPSVRPFSTTFRMAQTGGNYLLMRSRAHPQFDENGAVIRWNGLISPLIVDEGA
jgi:PAS domain-containing protein